MQVINRANTNSLWSSVLVECLVRCGLKYAVLSPGSRSTSLTVAFAAHPEVACIPVLDERSAGFFALGLAKQTHQPVVLVCTSGTAAVNYFPAVVEASEARVPLLILTADRPPELRDCGAGQTIDQIRLYGSYPIFQDEMPIPSASLGSLEALRNLLVNSYGHAMSGPVHLNCPFRDPLPPVEDGSVADELRLGEDYFDSITPPVIELPSNVEPISIDAARGLILCGTDTPEDPESYCKSVARLSEATGWPVLADGLSPARNYEELLPGVVSFYDLILRNSELRSSLRPECVIALGPLPTSKELRKWLAESDAQIFHVHQTGKNLDPTGKVVQVLNHPVCGIASRFNIHSEANSDYVRAWSEAQLKSKTLLGEKFEDETVISFEGLIAWRLQEWLPEATPVYVASSMPVRDVEYFWPPNNSKSQVYASRGVNGIDGTLSTALGVAHANKPSILLTGDLAFLHDSNGLLIRPKFHGHLTVVLINNQGGGIFNHLPIAKYEPPFEEFFATPQEVNFEKLVESMGCSYLKVQDLDDLARLLKSLPSDGIRIIEIETDRHRDSEYRKDLFKSISQTLA